MQHQSTSYSRRLRETPDHHRQRHPHWPHHADHQVLNYMIPCNTTELLRLQNNSKFAMNLGARQFCRIASDPSHPLFDRICFNQGKMPLRHKATIYPPNRANGQNVQIFFTSHFNSWSLFSPHVIHELSIPVIAFNDIWMQINNIHIHTNQLQKEERISQ